MDGKEEWDLRRAIRASLLDLTGPGQPSPQAYTAPVVPPRDVAWDRIEVVAESDGAQCLGKIL